MTKIFGSIIRGELMIHVECGEHKAHIVRPLKGAVMVGVMRGNGTATYSYHSTLDAAVACAHEAVTQ